VGKKNTTSYEEEKGGEGGEKASKKKEKAPPHDYPLFALRGMRISPSSLGEGENREMN